MNSIELSKRRQKAEARWEQVMVSIDAGKFDREEVIKVIQELEAIDRHLIYGPKRKSVS